MAIVLLKKEANIPTSSIRVVFPEAGVPRTRII